MLAALLGRCGEEEQPGRVLALERRHLRMAFGERAGLVEDDHRDLPRPLERRRIAQQYAPARADARADDDRRGRRQAEGAGAGDHQDRDRRNEGGLPIAAPGPPADEGQDGEPQHHRHEDGADPIHQLLDGRLARLGVLDQGDDPRQHPLMHRRARPDPQQPVAVEGATDHPGAGLLARPAGSRPSGGIHRPRSRLPAPRHPRGSARRA